MRKVLHRSATTCSARLGSSRPIVDAVVYHHEFPQSYPLPAFSPLAAVRVANQLVTLHAQGRNASDAELAALQVIARGDSRKTALGPRLCRK
jgi:hypothetical protein